MKALLKRTIVGVGCAGALRFAWYRRFGSWALRVTGSTAA